MRRYTSRHTRTPSSSPIQKKANVYPLDLLSSFSSLNSKSREHPQRCFANPSPSSPALRCPLPEPFPFPPAPWVRATPVHHQEVWASRECFNSLSQFFPSPCPTRRLLASHRQASRSSRAAWFGNAIKTQGILRQVLARQSLLHLKACPQLLSILVTQCSTPFRLDMPRIEAFPSHPTELSANRSPLCKQ